MWELFAGNYRSETRNDSTLVGAFFFLSFHWLIIIKVRSVRVQIVFVAVYLLITKICSVLD